jgi:hypothetical protein
MTWNQDLGAIGFFLAFGAGVFSVGFGVGSRHAPPPPPPQAASCDSHGGLEHSWHVLECVDGEEIMLSHEQINWREFCDDLGPEVGASASAITVQCSDGYYLVDADELHQFCLYNTDCCRMA